MEAAGITFGQEGAGPSARYHEPSAEVQRQERRLCSHDAAAQVCFGVSFPKEKGLQPVCCDGSASGLADRQVGSLALRPCC